jgi:hypothetical protein
MQRQAPPAANARVFTHVVYDTRLDALGTRLLRTIGRLFDNDLGGRGSPAELRYGMKGAPVNSYRGYVDLIQQFPTKSGAAKARGSLSGPRQLPETRAAAPSVQSILGQ